MFLNESSYYRANPYHKQGYLPDRAFVNRKPNEHLVELPQGDSHFEPTTRKHYAGLFDRSQIQQNKVLVHPEDEIKRVQVALKKQYPRNLLTHDIEGAVANTFVSPVIRNRMKSLQMREKTDQTGQSSVRNTPLNSNLSVKNPTFANDGYQMMTTKQEDEYKNKVIAEQMKQNKELAELMKNRNFHRAFGDNSPHSAQNLPSLNSQNDSNNYGSNNTGSAQPVQDKPNIQTEVPPARTKPTEYQQISSEPASYDYPKANNSRPTEQYRQQQMQQQQYRMPENYQHSNTINYDQDNKRTIQYQPPSPNKFKPVAQSIEISRRSHIQQRKNITPPSLDLQNLRYNYDPKLANAEPVSSRLNSSGRGSNNDYLKSQRSVSTPYKSIEPIDIAYAKKVNPTYLSFASNPFNYAAKNMLGR